MIQLKHIAITYGNLKVIEPTDFNFYKGEITALIGESGCGKTSVLDVLAYQNKENHYDYLETQDKESYLKSQLSYIKQDVELIDYMTCIDQLIWASKVAGKEKTKEAVMEVLKSVELEEVANKKPSQLSGGQRQRLGVALAIIKESEVILLDEITSALDKEHVDLIFGLLKEEAQKGKYIILATHDSEIYKQCDHIYHFEDGKVAEEKVTPKTQETIKIIHGIKTSKKDLDTLVNAFSKHYSRNKLILSIVLSFIIGLCSTGFLLNREYTHTINVALKNVQTYQSFITNAQFPNNASIDNSFIQNIQTIEGVETIYPYYSFDIGYYMYDIDYSTSERTQIIQEYDTLFKIKDDTQEYTVPTNALQQNDIHLIPYYDDLDLSTRSDTTVSTNQNKEGVYITAELSEAMNLENLNQHPEITMLCGIPVASREVYGNKEIIYKMKEMTFPVIGILSSGYQTYYTRNALYYDYHKMDQLLTEALQEVTLSNDIEAFKPEAYTVFTNDFQAVDEMKEFAENNDISIDNAMLSIQEMVSPLERIQSFLQQYTIILTCATFLICLIYGIYMYYSKRTSLKTLSHWGFNSKEMNYMLKKEYTHYLKWLWPLSLLIMIIASVFAYQNGYLSQGLSTMNMSYVVMTVFYLTIMVVVSLLIMEIFTFIRIRGDKHEK